MRESAAGKNAPQHRQALDDTLSELQTELEAHLTDGERISLPEFKQSRRQESRVVAATFNNEMEGERRCKLLRKLLDRLSSRSAAAAAGSSRSMEVL